MTWEQAFSKYWIAYSTKDGAKACKAAVAEGRALLRVRGPKRWKWLRLSLRDAQRKWFVAEVFHGPPVPKALMGDLIRASVYEPDPSFNRLFIEPVVRSFGAVAVGLELRRYLESGSDFEKAGAASAFYWCIGLASEGPLDRHRFEELRAEVRHSMLAEFVRNTDLDVRRRLIPMLELHAEVYPASIRPLVWEAVGIARAHSDPYIRHRVEIQLGGRGPLQPLPEREDS